MMLSTMLLAALFACNTVVDNGNDTGGGGDDTDVADSDTEDSDSDTEDSDTDTEDSDSDTEDSDTDTGVDADGDGHNSEVDCDDADPNINPSATELPYDGVDNDCNPDTLDDDLDEDSFIDADDCDDTDPDVNPSATELPYDGVDNDCNPDTLDDDLDEDTFIDADDCDDADPDVNPSATELPYDGVDNDCNPDTLDDDLDEDSFIDAADCDDTDPDVNPSATELPYDGVDNDCNPDTLDDDLDEDSFIDAADCDDTDPDVNPSATELPYDGVDNDCNPDTLDDDLDDDSFVNADDCDDTDPDVNPSATEVPGNGKDDDCNPSTPDVSSLDRDGDGHDRPQDCDDDDPNVHPGATESLDGLDSDCDGTDIDVLPSSGVVYVSKNRGNDGNPGTKAAPYATFSKGLDGAPPDGVVLIAEGTYATGRNFVNKSVTVIGSWRDDFDAWEPGAFPVTVNGPDFVVYTLGGARHVIAAITMTATNTPLVQGTGDLTVRHLQAQGAVSALTVSAGSSLRVEHSDFTSNDTAINLGAGANVSGHHLVATSANGHGIEALFAGDVTLTDVIATGGQDGFKFWNSGSADLERVDFTGTQYGASFQNPVRIVDGSATCVAGGSEPNCTGLFVSQDATIDRMVLRAGDGNQYSYALHTRSTTVVTNSVLLSAEGPNGSMGVQAISGDLTIVGSAIIAGGSWRSDGIHILNNANLTLVNTAVSHIPGDAYSHLVYVGKDGSAALDTVITSDDTCVVGFGGFAGQPHVCLSAAQASSCSAWSYGCSGVDRLSSAPLDFVDPQTDWHTKSSSALRDAAIDPSAYPVGASTGLDLYGVDRPTSGRDLGPSEE